MIVRVYHSYSFCILGRIEWERNDPEIISDALFALANIISFSRLVYILPTFESVGPLLVVLGKMITDVFRFAALLLIVFIAFTVGLHNHYHFYEGQTLPDGSETNSAFHGFFNTFRTLMWSIFGLGDPSSVEIHMKHAFVEIVGIIMVATFHIVIVIMLINMLIAMMTISFEAIHNDADIEWKAARTRLWLGYIGEGSTLPIPFNLIPSPKWLFYLFACKKCEAPSEKKEIEKSNEDYEGIMETLKERFKKKAEEEQKKHGLTSTRTAGPTAKGTAG
ncbi:short transient receptor potential channel 6-like [Lingula anatina]|uniref:Short transient receptor potential channel 6-like n=1 Tax=Lingula anatina TaxID=7574 RepID=A0A2R2MTA0_LINAN|nr:short transient receptor potential channel 6-like [Lingula anatina]|eukprot:XP_023933486.1 short transient receptor potential channel 6-like [Lingula anatina]